MGEVQTKRDERSSGPRGDERDEAFISRLSECISIVGGQTAMARKADLSLSGLQKYLHGGEPTRRKLLAIAEAAGVSFAWLATGQNLENYDSDKKRKYFFDEEHLPRVNVSLSGGDGAIINNQNIIDHVLFSQKWLRDKIGKASSDRLAIVGVVGDSMEPTVHEGDDVMVDLSVTELIDNAIYAMRWGDNLVIKRLQRLMKGAVIISDNPSYRDQEIQETELSDLHIIGRVRWIGHIV